MDFASILVVIAKGMSVIQALSEVSGNLSPAITAVKNLVAGAKEGNVTQADLDATEALLDSLIAEFNLELPPEE